MARPTAARPVPKPPPEVMTISDLASYLQVPQSSLYKLAQVGKVPGMKVGRHWRFRKETIDRWLENGTPNQPRRPRGD